MPGAELSLYDLLKSGLTALPMHMPGHKRNALLAPYLDDLGAALDITEIHSFDNLHNAQGVLRESMVLAAQVFGARHTIYSVNGATAGILAGIGALTKPKDKVLVARNCHLSVINALRLFGLRPVFLQPPLLADWSIFGSLDIEAVADALRTHPDAALLVLTSPTYEGVISDVAGIVAAAHAAGMPVLVDEAHGAHLDLSPDFFGGAVRGGADVVVQSLHKTLLSLTQTAVIHAREEHTAREIRNRMRMLETSSPSYLLLASIDGCVRLLAQRKEPLMDAWYDALLAFHAAVRGLTHLRILTSENAPQGIHALDPSKLLIHTGGTGLSGKIFAVRLRNDHGIECEMALPNSVLAMTGMGDTKETLLQLAQALLALDDAGNATAENTIPAWPQPETALPMDEAAMQPYELVPFANATGRISAEVVTLYPPGAPLLVPGERVTAEVIAMLRHARDEQSTVFFERGSMEALAVLTENASTNVDSL